jgi:hypothetical protein
VTVGESDGVTVALGVGLFVGVKVGVAVAGSEGVTVGLGVIVAVGGSGVLDGGSVGSCIIVAWLAGDPQAVNRKARRRNRPLSLP